MWWSIYPNQNLFSTGSTCPFFFFSSIFVFQSHPSIYQMRLVSILSPHTQGHKTLIQILTLSHPCDSFFTLNSSNHQLMHEPPTCSLVRSLPSVMTFLCGRYAVSDKQMMQHVGNRSITYVDPTPIHLYRLIYPLIAGAASSIKDLPAPLAGFISAQNETVGIVDDE